MLAHEVKARIEDHLVPTSCQVHEFSGGTDHYRVVVVSPAFEGRSLLTRHRLVMDLFQEEIRQGIIHALSLETLTPPEWEQKK